MNNEISVQSNHFCSNIAKISINYGVSHIGEFEPRYEWLMTDFNFRPLLQYCKDSKILCTRNNRDKNWLSLYKANRLIICKNWKHLNASLWTRNNARFVFSAIFFAIHQVTLDVHVIWPYKNKNNDHLPLFQRNVQNSTGIQIKQGLDGLQKGIS